MIIAILYCVCCFRAEDVYYVSQCMHVHLLKKWVYTGCGYCVGMYTCCCAQNKPCKLVQCGQLLIFLVSICSFSFIFGFSFFVRLLISSLSCRPISYRSVVFEFLPVAGNVKKNVERERITHIEKKRVYCECQKRWYRNSEGIRKMNKMQEFMHIYIYFTTHRKI